MVGPKPPDNQKRLKEKFNELGYYVGHKANITSVWKYLKSFIYTPISQDTVPCVPILVYLNLFLVI